MGKHTTWIYLVRHGETDWNVQGRWQGHAITPLNSNGKREAALVAKRLASEGMTALYSSDSPRASQTAEAIASATGLPLVTDARLREMDLGDWQGLTREEIEAIDGERFAARIVDPLNIPVPGGESRADLIARVKEAIGEIVGAHAGERVATVGHGGSIKAALLVLDGRPLETWPDVWLTNTSVTVLRGTPGVWEVVTLNDATHLKRPEN